MIVSAVVREDIPALWHIIEPMLEQALEYSPERFDTVDIYADLLTSKLSLWIAIEDEEIVSCAVIRIYDTPLTRVLSLDYLAGKDMESWLNEGHETINRYAYDNKCRRMECRGRPGWSKPLKGLGWEAVAVCYERAVTVPETVKDES